MFLKIYEEEKIRKEIITSTEINYSIVLWGSLGKKELIRSIFSDIVFVDAAEFNDVKMLEGFYAFIQGEIQFKKSILIDAMEKGKKICFTHIDKSIALQQFLMSVVSEGSLVLASGETVHAHKNFRILFTSKEKFVYRNVNFVGPLMNMKYTEKLLKIGVNKDSCKKNSTGECNEICLKQNQKCLCNKIDERFLCDQCALNYVTFKRMTKGLGITKQDRIKKLFVYKNVFLEHNSTKLFESSYLDEEDWKKKEAVGALVETYFLNEIMRSVTLNITNKINTLFVGETGGGKTAFLQELAKTHNKELTVINLSSDFDCFDLVGGYKAVDVNKKIAQLAKLLTVDVKDLNILKTYCVTDEHLALLHEIEMYKKHKIAFEYKKGIIINAMEKGDWVLLDEVNLVEEQGIAFIDALSACKDTFLHHETNTEVNIHSEFLLFACMNPFGDFGKKEFVSKNFIRLNYEDYTERVDELRFITNILIKQKDNNGLKETLTEYFHIFKNNVRAKTFCNLLEPILTGRTFKRMINFINNEEDRSKLILRIYKACHLFLFTQVDLNSRASAINLFKEMFAVENIDEELTGNKITNLENYVLTQQTKIVITDIVLAIENNLPLLLQGSTAAGKTSLLVALAKKDNKKVVRINNFDGTDISDYLGCYKSNNGNFVFQCGPLVNALRNGHWIILDELNLAASDVLEALNRLLDDNKEIYIEETNEIIKPHPEFRLFATQNINYSGRKGLAKSFRNRFIEITFVEKNENDIREILKSKDIPKGYISVMLECYTNLNTKLFMDSENTLTIRELLKWSNRKNEDYTELFWNGVELLTFKHGKETKEKAIEIIYGVFVKNKRIKEKFIKVMENRMYKIDEFINEYRLNNTEIIMTPAYKTVIYAIYNAWSNNESVLFLGETGIGKTLLCKFISEKIFQKSMQSINCNENTDECDFLGMHVMENKQIVWKESNMVKALKDNNTFLIDEVNLVENGVLERLNSLLETTRTLFIPEIDEEYTFIDAKIVATLNPAGDYGKKELSPALKNRFTELNFTVEEDNKQMIFEGLVGNIFAADLLNKLFSNSNVIHFIKTNSARKTKLFLDFIQTLHGIYNGQENKFGLRINFNNATFDGLIEEALGFMNNALTQRVNYALDNVESTNTYTLLTNCEKLLRAFLVPEKSALLVGAPGTGKTSIVKYLARVMHKSIIRINLSENTEIDDLLGSVVPCGSDLIFRKSRLTQLLSDPNAFILLDEINLCSQSVLEGLNSILDHRREIILQTGEKIQVHAKIFGTMNPATTKGRKELPMSFLDRFIVIDVEDYTEEEKEQITRKYLITDQMYKYDHKISLRGNIKNIKMEQIKSNYNDHQLKLNQSEYFIDHKYFTVGDIFIQYHHLDNNYTLVHSQLDTLTILLKCILNDIPVILKGKTGRKPLVEFVGELLGKEVKHIYMSKETEISDIIGGYVKSGDNFAFKTSPLVNYLQTNCLIVLHNAEYVDKSIWDRLNGIFEMEKELIIHENVSESNIEIHPDCRILCIAEEEKLFSEPFLDRSHVINLSEKYDQVDLLKIVSDSTDSIQNILTDVTDINLLNIEKYIKVKKYQNIDSGRLNHLIETDIIKNISTKKYLIAEINTEIVQYYTAMLEYSTTDAFILTDTIISNKLRYDQNSIDIKISYIENIKHKKQKDYPEMVRTVEKLRNINDVIITKHNLNSWNDHNVFHTDPALEYSKYISNIMHSEINEILLEQDEILLDIYKYSTERMEEYQRNITKIENIREKYKNRNMSQKKHSYEEYKNTIKRIVSGSIKYSDIIINMDIIEEYKEYFYYLMNSLVIINDKSKDVQNNYNEAALQLIKNGQIRHVLEGEYTQTAVEKLIDGEISQCKRSGLILDSLINNNKKYDLDPMLLNMVRYEESEINHALLQLVERSSPQICAVDNRKNKIYDYSKITKDREVMGMIESSCIFMKPEELYGDIKGYEDMIKKECFMSKKLLLYNTNYNWFVFYVENIPTEEYFYSFTVGEFIQQLRMLRLFIEEYEKIKTDEMEKINIYKNWYYLMSAFEIEKKDNEKQRKVSGKLGRAHFTTVNRYLTVLDEYRGRWLSQMVVSVFDVKSIDFDNKDKNKEEDVKRVKLEESLSMCLILKNKKNITHCKKYTGNISEYYIKHNMHKNIKVCKLIHMFNGMQGKIVHGEEIKYLIKEIVDYALDDACVRSVYEILVEDKCEEIIDEEVGQGLKNEDESVEEVENSDNSEIKEEDIEDEYDKNESVEEKSGAEEVEKKGDAKYEEREEDDEKDGKEDYKEGMIDEEEESNEGNEKKEEDELNEEIHDGEGNFSKEEENTTDENIGESIEGGKEEESNSDVESNDSENNSESNTSENNKKNTLTEYIYDENALDEINLNQTCDVDATVDEKMKIKCEGGRVEKLEKDDHGEIDACVEEGNTPVENTNAQEILSGLENIRINTNTNKKYNCISLINCIKSVIETNKNSKYKGCYKSGKKLSIKALVKYIASNYTKDRIWMRRSKNKYNYKFNLYVDNSKSMLDYDLVDMLSSVINILKVLFNHLGIEFKIFKFGSKTEEVDPSEIENVFTFDENSTNMDFISAENNCYNLILTDGIFNSGMMENYIALIIDRKGIKNMKKISMVGNELVSERYLSAFGLRYRIVEKVEDIENEIVEVIKMFFRN